MTTRFPSDARVCWEYTTHSIHHMPRSDDLDPFGEEGFELVSVTLVPTRPDWFHCIFKRPILEKTE